MTKKRRLWLRIKYFIFPCIVTTVLIIVMIWTVSRLNKPEYAALVIALMGIAFTFWWDAYKEIVNRRRSRLTLMSQLMVELKQNSNTINSILDIEKRELQSSLPAPLRTVAWVAAAASPYFVWIKGEIVDNLISIYGRLDAANYYADIFKMTSYSAGGTTYEADSQAKDARELYISIVTVVSKQINQVLSLINNEIEEIKMK